MANGTIARPKPGGDSGDLREDGNDFALGCWASEGKFECNTHHLLSTATMFAMGIVNKASKKKREKSSAKKERKATKTLAIVLAGSMSFTVATPSSPLDVVPALHCVFLFCWVPFFTCNIMDAMCAKLNKDCRPGVTIFNLTTWLGYMNSFVNPVIYTIFNPEFRKAFKKIMNIE
ncbi:hypothetical protein AND_000926 [Anopheles darlingi]|uniref:G-protein coupled receptors family 1 profile domain-containing protein n=1 Tax=Anopheles darlingi TaxID=43151 RepID=W5JWB3_ANODA|nr:hypothetical protein AND_000926 [Anopheles darlingi]